MKIMVNGTLRQFEVVHNVHDLLEKLGYHNPFVAVAINRTCIPKASLKSTEVREGDEVEILAPQQGG